jgi:hypothetical protein
VTSARWESQIVIASNPLDDQEGGKAVAAVPGAHRAAAIASLGAGAIHATAAGAHGDPRAAATAFAVTAALQIGWGALALVRSGTPVSLAGVAVNAGAIGGWVLAKTSGIGFVDGLDAKEDPQFADTLAAGLAAVAVIGALLALARRVDWVARPRPALVGAAALATLALAVPGMVSTGNHSHAGGHGHDDEAAGHGHGGEAGHDHAEMAEPKPYDATLPVDLGGTPGVTADQQAEAEELVTETLETLPKFADWTTLEAQGWYSIGDGITGHEHFINWPLLDDGREFDPDYPESLVYEVDRTGEKKLVAAMFMLERGVSLDDAPDIGGDLIQWHEHNDICYRGEENKWRIGALAAPPAECPPGTFRTGQSPMVHVWITPHECGPFAALEGNGGGEIPEGEARLCDHHHGAPTGETAAPS